MKKILLYISTLFLSYTSYSQNSSDTTYLEETVIQAYKAERVTPITFKSISNQELDKVNIGQEPSQILSFTPSINIYSDAGNYQGYSYFRLRGIDQTRVNMTLDGIPLNESEDQGVYFSNYPDFFNSINGLQIQRGVGTTTNGVASYAGSINYQSPNLRDKQKIETGINYGSFNTYRIYGEYNSGLKNNKAFYARASHLTSDGYKYHSSNQSSSAFTSFGLFKARHQLKLTGFIGNQKNELAWIGVPIEKIKENPRTNGNSNENDTFSQALTSIQHSYTLHSNATLNTTLYYNYLEGNYDFDLNNFLGFPSTDEMYNYDFQHQMIGGFSNISVDLKRLKLNAGFHLNTFSRRHIGSEKNTGQLYQNKGFKNEFSSFLKLHYTIDNFVLFGDIQYRYTDFAYEGSATFNKVNWQFINPKIGVSYFINKETNFYYSYGASGREPTRNDLFNGEDNLPVNESGIAVSNDIAPEYVYNHELGFRTQKKQWHLATNLYWMNFEDEIVLNGQYGPNGLALHSNVAKSFRSGVEFDFKTHILKRCYYTNNSSFSYNRISENEVEFKPILTPNIITNQMLSFESESVNAGIIFKYQSKSYISFDNKDTVPSFYSIDLSASYQLAEFTFQAKLNNVTNQHIITNGYTGLDGTPLYFVQAPTNFNLGIIWKH